MTGLLNYSLQTLLCATVVCLFSLQRRNLDAYVALLVSFWTIAVVLIYAKYGVEQTSFYSNDQDAHFVILNEYLPQHGIPFRLEEMISWRYLAMLPAYFLSKIGFDGILMLKFQQLVYLVLIYQLGRKFLQRHQVVVKWWQLILFCGPISIFMSVFALRDISIGFFTALFIVETRNDRRLIGLVGSFLLRPHLAAALLVGQLAAYIIRLVRPKYFLFTTASIALIAYTSGSFMYYVGARLQYGLPLRSASKIFTQSKFSQMGANFVGLQFLTLDDSVVSASITSLLLGRLIFVDTWLVPLIFIGLLVQYSAVWTSQRIMLFTSFMFFFGLVSQTTSNSSRQNIPFLITMGLLAVVGIESRRQTKTLDFVS